MTQTTFLEVTAGKRKRNELTLPILHFPVVDPLMADSWIKALGPKAFCAWLQLHTLVDRSEAAHSKYDNQNTIPRSLESMAKDVFGVSKSTLYRTIIRPLWNHGLIDIVEWEADRKNGEKAKNIIVYHYPQNDKSLETKGLKKIRDYDQDYTSNGKTFGQIGGRPTSSLKQNTDLINRFKNKTVDSTKVLFTNVDLINRFKNKTVTVSKIKPINISNTLFNKSNTLKDLNTDTYLDTENQLDENEYNKFSPFEEQKLYKQYYVKNNKSEINPSIMRILHGFANDAEQLDNWTKILLRSKSAVEKNYDELILLENDKVADIVNTTLVNCIRKLRSSSNIKDPNSYLYKSLTTTFEQIAEILKGNGRRSSISPTLQMFAKMLEN